MQEEKTGLIDGFFIACFRPSEYDTTLMKNSTGRLIRHLLVLMAFVVFIDTVIPFAAWDASVGGLSNLFLKGIPEFSLKNGSLEAKEPLEFALGNALHVKVDADKESFDKDDIKMEYAQEFLLSHSNLVMSADYAVREVKLADWKDISIDNRTLVDMLPVFRIVITISILMSLGIRIAEYLFTALFYAFFCRRSVRTEDGKSVSFGQAFIISIYAKTLFAIIGSVDTALGHPLPATLLILVSVFVTMSYISRVEMKMLGVDKKWNIKL